MLILRRLTAAFVQTSRIIVVHSGARARLGMTHGLDAARQRKKEHGITSKFLFSLKSRKSLVRSSGLRPTVLDHAVLAGRPVFLPGGGYVLSRVELDLVLPSMLHVCIPVDSVLEKKLTTLGVENTQKSGELLFHNRRRDTTSTRETGTT